MTQFYLFSSAGNTTLFLMGKGSAAMMSRAMELISCEQAAWADLPGADVRMAGGEFCVNACLACAALLHLLGHDARVMRMKNLDVAIEASGSSPHWQAKARFPVDMAWVDCAGGTCLAHLPGIVHVVRDLRDGESGFPDDPVPVARELWTRLGLNDEPASGVIWRRRRGAVYEILPVVQVPGASTCNVEQACGSGSLAAVMQLPDGFYDVSQPSGLILTVRKSRDVLALSGPVDLLARGELCPP